MTASGTPQSTADETHGHEYSEETPLKLKPAMRKATPLPLLQLTILCLARLAEPIAYTQIFPYINQMMEDLHVTDDPSQIGFYSGLVDSVFAVAQLATAYRWGKLSDRLGRLPVLLMGLCGAALSSISFGLSNSLAMAVITRSLAGALSGNVVVVSTMIGEMTDETNVARAVALPGICWSVGCIIGPLIGGTFSHPATRYPEIFGDIQFLHQFPYFLPSFISFMITVFSIVFAYCFVEETLPSKIAANAKKAASPLESKKRLPSYGSVTIVPAQPTPPLEEKELSAMELFYLPAPRSTFIATFMLAFISMGWEVVFTLFSYTRISLGGIERSTAQIGYALAGAGLFAGFFQLVIFPSLQRRFDNVPFMTCLMGIWPAAVLVIPLLGVVARLGLNPDGTISPEGESSIRVGIAGALMMSRVACMSFSLNMILIKNAAPSKGSLGAMYGLAQSAASIARAVSPAFVSSLFAVSIEKHIWGGNLVWAIMFALACLSVYTARNVIDGETKKWSEMEE
ncbi:hypothetical protein BOTBODRAFT_32469 [Botryobasidium botryosum FD-172 SS1]|uniref:Major facilitator superfamily (MFS) profile domain-containing protein n=1 Tax=Botryobasidium botryosum (strain FD-172 SS1) TaxID=930990 RepID=A0A067MS73_BOTB1|nr:hypothetical protein BOTBODRAFT_32469 [Botryobasidium botryosum FD-172 SS1]